MNTVPTVPSRHGTSRILAAIVWLCCNGLSGSAFAALPPARSIILELRPGVTFGGTKDMKDLYGQGLIWPASGAWIGDFDFGLGYCFTERFQCSLLYGGKSKLWSVTDEFGITEDWDLGVHTFEIRSRYLIPTAGSVCWSLGAGIGSGTLAGTYRASGAGVTGLLDLSGSNTSGWLEAGPEWRWTRFALGLTGGYRFLTIEPVGAKGRIMDVGYSTRHLPTITGKKAHFDYSGFELALACRWYLGGRAPTTAAHSAPAQEPSGFQPDVAPIQ